MPIVRVESLATPDDMPGFLHAVSLATATALATEPARCWVAFHPLAPGHYLEGGAVRGAADARHVSPLVTLSLKAGRPDAALRAALAAIAAAVGDGLGLDPDLVFVALQELPAGRVFSGGRILD